MPQFHAPEVAALAALFSDVVANNHGEGTCHFTNYDRTEQYDPSVLFYDFPHGWANSADRLELWSDKYTLPGTNVKVTVLYFCAINDMGTFDYSVHPADLENWELSQLAAEKWMYWAETHKQAREFDRVNSR